MTFYYFDSTRIWRSRWCKQKCIDFWYEKGDYFLRYERHIHLYSGISAFVSVCSSFKTIKSSCFRGFQLFPISWRFGLTWIQKNDRYLQKLVSRKVFNKKPSAPNTREVFKIIKIIHGLCYRSRMFADNDRSDNWQWWLQKTLSLEMRWNLILWTKYICVPLFFVYVVSIQRMYFKRLTLTALDRMFYWRFIIQNASKKLSFKTQVSFLLP